MSRNEEKQLGRLNRIHLHKQKEAHLEKNPIRPPLTSLNSAAEVQKWLPSIKKDIQFCLQQSRVTCYTPEHSREYLERVDKLQREYKRFVAKLRQLKPGLAHTPWTDRPYTRRRPQHAPSRVAATDSGDFVRIATPVLDNEVAPVPEATATSDQTESQHALADAPLDFRLTVTPLVPPVILPSMKQVEGELEVAKRRAEEAAKPFTNRYMSTLYGHGGGQGSEVEGRTVVLERELKVKDGGKTEEWTGGHNMGVEDVGCHKGRFGRTRDSSLGERNEIWEGSGVTVLHRGGSGVVNPLGLAYGSSSDSDAD